jgi:sugar/nucleoside kinase (ribokinase family)
MPAPISEEANYASFMRSRRETLLCAADKLASSFPTGVRCLVGFDGFIDDIIDVVDVRRSMRRDDYTRLETMEAYAARVQAFARRSMNLELVVKESRFGGNGPLMAGGLAMLGARTSYVGCVGQENAHSQLHPLYNDLRDRCERTGGGVVPIAPPAHTAALEFDDGKIMQGNPLNLYRATWEGVKNALGESTIVQMVENSDLLGIVNWVMMPGVGGPGGIWEGLTNQVLPKLKSSEPKHIFIDLCDPAKRTDADVATALTQLRAMNSVKNAIGARAAKVTLGLNLAEAQRIDAVCGSKGFAGPSDHPSGEKVLLASQRIRETLGLHCVVIHPREGAGATIETGQSAWFDGPLCEKPKLSTGAGDHFNSGFALALAMNLSADECLAVGTSVSGLYVREAQSPTRPRLIEFARSLAQG